LLDGDSLDDAIEIINQDDIDTLIIIENDLYRRTSREKVEALFEKCRQVIVLDHLMNQTAQRADILLPAATFAESIGTIVNNEGRAQRYYSVLPLNEPVKESWRWITEMMKISEKSREITWENFDDIVTTLASSNQAFSALKEKMFNADSRFFNEKISRQNKRFSGRTAMNSHLSVSEPKPPGDPDSPLNFSMEGYQVDPPSSLIPFYWSPGWNSCQAMKAYMNEPEGNLKNGGDPGVRLFSAGTGHKTGYFKSSLKLIKSDPMELLFVPAFRIFGSEELSSRGEAIAGLIPGPFVLLNENEIRRLHLVENNEYEIIINEVAIKVRIEINNTLPDGVAGLSCLTTIKTYPDIPDRGKVNNDKKD
jgi:NADH-quinone oxidoreductase subunit G